CRSSPRIEAKPPRPPKRPWPNSIPNSPPPRNPANIPPRNPGRLKNPPAGDVAGRPTEPGLPGCVMLPSIGRAVGDVVVDGGAEKVREPRLPKLPPPPGRASALLTTSANAAARAQTASSGRKRRPSMNSSQG